MLVHQLKGDSSSVNDFQETKQLALEESPKEDASENNTSADISPINLLQTSLNIKHCNSFNSDVLEPSKSENDCDSNSKGTALTRIEKHRSADSEVLGNGLFAFFFLSNSACLCGRYKIVIRRQKTTSGTYKAVDGVEGSGSHTKKANRSLKFNRFSPVGATSKTSVFKPPNPHHSND